MGACHWLRNEEPDNIQNTIMFHWLIERDLVVPYEVRNLGHRWFSSWFFVYSVPSHDLNQWWIGVDCTLNTLRLRRNRRRFADDIFKCFFLNENVWISIRISLKFVPMGPINNNTALVQIMASCRLGNKPLFEPMMVSFLTHICVTQPQFVKNELHWNFKGRYGTL